MEREVQVIGERILTKALVAKKVDKSPRTLERWVRDPENDFPRPVKVGGRIGWRLRDVDAWINSLPAFDQESQTTTASS